MMDAQAQPQPIIVDPHHTLPATILLCPGQGAQHVGMGQVWDLKYPTSQAVFDEADKVLGFEISKLCFNGPEDQLNRTDVAQAAIYVTSIACYRALAEQNRIGKITCAAGLSLGEFTALHLAGAFDFETGLKLVRLRGQAMQEAAQAVPSSMVALIGTDEGQAQLLCDRVLNDLPGQVLVCANFNCPGQIVLSGGLQACQHAVQLAEEMDMRATLLKVAGAFHSPLMQPAAQRLGEALDKVQWNMPHIPVLSNVTGVLHEINKVDMIKKRLVEQLTRPVRWEQSMIWAMMHIPGHFVELAPGKVLSGLMRRIDKSIKVENFAEPH
ncbi:MAG: ACP S-malonyltransferase [Phycisphaeraceae bacterium]